MTSGGEYGLYIKLETDGKPDNAFQVAETGIYTIEVNTSSMKMKCTKIADYEDPNLVFTKETFHSTSEGSLNYRKLKPPTIEKGKQYPLVIFLHGAGERGSDNESQLRYGSERIILHSYYFHNVLRPIFGHSSHNRPPMMLRLSQSIIQPPHRSNW